MFISRDDAQLYTVAFGDGPRALLALGGWIGSWELWAGPFGYLSRTWRTVAYDHRGAGATIAPPESISPETLVDDVFAVLDELEIARCVLAAESAGAAVALLAALRQPQRFGGLVIVDGRYYEAAPHEPSPFLSGLRASYQATLDQFAAACVPEPGGAPIRRWGRQILARAEQPAAIRLYECMREVDLRPRAHEIVPPTLILHGEADVIVPMTDARWLAERIPNSRLVVLPGAGHVPTMTRPREVAAAIDEFFAPERRD